MSVPSALATSGHNLRVKTQWHHGNRCTYELTIATNDLTNLRAQFQHLFSSAPPSSASCFRDLMNQPDALGLAKNILLQLSCPCRQVQLYNPSLPCSSCNGGGQCGLSATHGIDSQGLHDLDIKRMTIFESACKGTCTSMCTYARNVAGFNASGAVLVDMRHQESIQGFAKGLGN
eukprot:1159175-Pelagomonas_calceolata.AAC.23